MTTILVIVDTLSINLQSISYDCLTIIITIIIIIIIIIIISAFRDVR